MFTNAGAARAAARSWRCQRSARLMAHRPEYTHSTRSGFTAAAQRSVAISVPAFTFIVVIHGCPLLAGEGSAAYSSMMKQAHERSRCSKKCNNAESRRHTHSRRVYVYAAYPKRKREKSHEEKGALTVYFAEASTRAAAAAQTLETHHLSVMPGASESRPVFNVSSALSHRSFPYQCT